MNLLTIKQVAEQLGVSVHSVRRYIDSGKLPASKVGSRLWRIRPEDIEAFVKKDEGLQAGRDEQRKPV